MSEEIQVEAVADTANESDSTESESNVDTSNDPQISAVEVSPDFRKYKHKVKIDGDENEVEYDKLVESYQKGVSSDKKYQQAAELRKQVDDFVNDLQGGNYNRLVDAMGKEQAIKFAEDLLIEKMQYEEMSDEQKDAVEAKRENAELKKYKESQEAERTKAHEAKVYQDAAQDIENEIIETFTKLGKKPTPRLIYRIADQMLQTLDYQDERISAEEAFGRADGNLKEEISDILDSMDEEQLIEYLPKSVVKRLKKQQIREIKKEPLRVASEINNLEDNKSRPQNKSKKKRMATDDWFTQRQAFLRS